MSTLRHSEEVTYTILQTRPVRLEICCPRSSDTFRTRRSVHLTLGHHASLHSDTTSGYTLGHRAPLHSDTTSGYTLGHWAPDPCVCPLGANTSLCSDTQLRYLRTLKLRIRALDSCSLKDEHSSNSWSELRIRVFLLLLPLFFFLLTSYYSHLEVRIQLPQKLAQTFPLLLKSIHIL